MRVFVHNVIFKEYKSGGEIGYLGRPRGNLITIQRLQLFFFLPFSDTSLMAGNNIIKILLMLHEMEHHQLFKGE